MIHVFFPPPADIIMLPSWEERSAAATPAFPTCVRAPTAAGTKLPEAALGDTAAEPAWLTRVEQPRAVDIGPTKPTAVCSRQHARQSTALSAPEEGFPRTMVVVVVWWWWLLAQQIYFT